MFYHARHRFTDVADISKFSAVFAMNLPDYKIIINTGSVTIDKSVDTNIV